jgi:hypothetical protein
VIRASNDFTAGSAVLPKEFPMSTRSLLHGFLVVSLLAGSALTLPAQGSATADLALPTSAVITSAIAEAAPVTNEGARVLRSGVTREAATTFPAPQLMQGADRRNVAWMAVGLAALTAGLLIGGDAGSVVAITGGVIGLVGLFRYMN